MPTLNWIGKEAVVKHHKDVPFRLLEPVPELSCGPSEGRDSGNLIVQGDNLHALKALLPRYAGPGSHPVLGTQPRSARGLLIFPAESGWALLPRLPLPIARFSKQAGGDSGG